MAHWTSEHGDMMRRLTRQEVQDNMHLGVEPMDRCFTSSDAIQAFEGFAALHVNKLQPKKGSTAMPCNAHIRTVLKSAMGPQS